MAEPKDIRQRIEKINDLIKEDKPNPIVSQLTMLRKDAEMVDAKYKTDGKYKMEVEDFERNLFERCRKKVHTAIENGTLDSPEELKKNEKYLEIMHNTSDYLEDKDMKVTWAGFKRWVDDYEQDEKENAPQPIPPETTEAPEGYQWTQEEYADMPGQETEEETPKDPEEKNEPAPAEEESPSEPEEDVPPTQEEEVHKIKTAPISFYSLNGKNDKITDPMKVAAERAKIEGNRSSAAALFYAMQDFMQERTEKTGMPAGMDLPSKDGEIISLKLNTPIETAPELPTPEEAGLHEEGRELPFILQDKDKVTILTKLYDAGIDVKMYTDNKGVESPYAEFKDNEQLRAAMIRIAEKGETSYDRILDAEMLKTADDTKLHSTFIAWADLHNEDFHYSVAGRRVEYYRSMDSKYDLFPDGMVDVNVFHGDKQITKDELIELLAKNMPQIKEDLINAMEAQFPDYHFRERVQLREIMNDVKELQKDIFVTIDPQNKSYANNMIKFRYRGVLTEENGLQDQMHATFPITLKGETRMRDGRMDQMLKFAIDHPDVMKRTRETIEKEKAAQKNKAKQHSGPGTKKNAGQEER